MTTTNYLIPLESKDAFVKVFNRAVRKAVKLGVEPMTYTVGNPVQTEIVVRGHGTGRYVTNLPLSITGTNPSLNGWKLTAVVSPLKTDTGAILPLITTVPGETVSETRTSTDPLKCDHCNARRDRLETFVVLHEDGTEKQVGRQCLADFLGGANQNHPAALANLAGLRTELDNAIKGFAHTSRTFYSDSLETVFAVTLSVTRLFPWVPVSLATKTGQTATRTYVGEVMGAMSARPNPDEYEGKADMLAANMLAWERSFAGIIPMIPTDADFARARELMDVVAVYLDSEEERGALNDYLASCRVIMAARTANRKAFGIACSMVQLGIRALEGSKPAEAKKESQFVGIIGKRQTFTATLTNTIRGDTWTIRVFTTPEGDTIKTFTDLSVSEGVTVTFKATPTKHSEYKGRKETVVNRVKIQ